MSRIYATVLAQAIMEGIAMQNAQAEARETVQQEDHLEAQHIDESTSFRMVRNDD